MTRYGATAIDPQQQAVTFTGTAAVAMRRAVTVVVFTIAGLTFAFGFGNGYAVGLQLGVPGWIAPRWHRLWICRWWPCWLRCSICGPMA